ncbi:hypothetical protein DWG14_07744 [Streptomyces griseorubiginosus]|uniref:Uncharacterized protein n=1 Tax=Streptomyces griseorubiginosus TaxID=67304 RepID=A0AAI8L8F3_9ACTN|nr:hypothetical protein DWG14_07744 [Streptomyces griseorubiginosus]
MTPPRVCTGPTVGRGRTSAYRKVASASALTWGASPSAQLTMWLRLPVLPPTHGGTASADPGCCTSAVWRRPLCCTRPRGVGPRRRAAPSVSRRPPSVRAAGLSAMSPPLDGRPSPRGANTSARSARPVRRGLAARCRPTAPCRPPRAPASALLTHAATPASTHCPPAPYPCRHAPSAPSATPHPCRYAPCAPSATPHPRPGGAPLTLGTPPDCARCPQAPHPGRPQTLDSTIPSPGVSLP